MAELLEYYTGKKPAGFIIVSDPGIPGGKVEYETRMCAHCGKHWIYQPGSGKKYGVCAVCGGYVCDNPKCQRRCTPLDEKFELVEMKMDTF